MKRLSLSWFVEGTPDIEYKQYVLLAYLQYVNRKFTQTKLYPHLSELVTQYRSLKVFLDDEKDLYDKFPAEIQGFDWERFKVAYKKVIEDEDLMDSIRTIVRWSIPKIEKHLEEGKEIHEFLEKNISLSPVGIEPLNKDVGYLFVQNGKARQVSIFQYSLTLYEESQATYRAIKTKFLREYKRSISRTEQNIKTELIRSNRLLPNPATYSVEAAFHVPMKQTLMPIVKRMLARYLSTDEQGYSSSGTS